jgi:hypothetical protein
MGKFVGALLPIAGAVLGGIVGGPIGASIGAAIGSAVSIAFFAPAVPPPETVESEIKTSIPPRVHVTGTRRMYGASILFETLNDGHAVDIWAFGEGPADGRVAIYLNDDRVTIIGENRVNGMSDGRYKDSHVRADHNLGLNPETAFARFLFLKPGVWTANHRGDGVVCGWLTKQAVEEKKFLEVYPQGDNISMSLVLRWALVFDPRDPAQDAYDESTWAWSDNACLCFLWYQLKHRGVDYDTKIVPHLAKWIAAINDCDDDQALAAGGTEKRYRADVAFKSTDDPAAVTAEFLKCFDGWYCPDETGALIVYSGRYYEPTVTIGPDQIVSYRHQAFVPDEDRLNDVAIAYFSDLHDYTQVDAEAWRDEADISERGKEVSTQLVVQCRSHTQARRLAKRKMARVNATDRGTITTNFSGRAMLGQRFIWVTIIEAGATFYDGPAEVIGEPQIDPNTGGVTFDWIAVDPNVDAWNPETEDGLPAPTSVRTLRPAPEVPVITAAAATFTTAVDNAGTGARILITAEAPEQAGITWFARWRLAGASIWNEQRYDDIVPGASVELLTGFVPVAPEVEVQVEYRSSDGRLSGWSATYDVDTRTDVVAPDEATAITLVSWVDSISLTTDPIARATTYRWRFFSPANLVTPIRTIFTPTRNVAYPAAQAALDGARRDYVVDVAGVNGGGTGASIATGTITNAPPSLVTGLVATGGATIGEISFDLLPEGDVAGYSIFYATIADFNPSTQGLVIDNNGYSPQPIYTLDAGTYYARVAAFDAWSRDPALLNVTDDTSFTITSGGGGTGGGGGGGGGGYCVTLDTMILLADGTQRAAGELEIGDMLWTQPETETGLGPWGAYPVSAIEIVEADILRAQIGSPSLGATAMHRVWLSGGWVHMASLGVPDGRADVARITVADAHTYVSNGVLSHNAKPTDDI